MCEAYFVEAAGGEANDGCTEGEEQPDHRRVVEIGRLDHSKGEQQEQEERQQR